MLIDTHAHLTDSQYGDVRDIIDSMRRDNLSRIISVGYDATTSEKSSVLAQNNENIYFAAGIHPSEANCFTSADLDKIERLIRHPKCVALGEIGLDYHYPETDKQNQMRLLYAQTEILKNSGLPVAFHVRDADGDMLAFVKSNLDKMPKRGVMHCFSGSAETAVEYVKMGFYISFSGSITFKNNAKFPQVISAIPRDRVLIETDCPYLAPTPHRGKLNYPAFVSFTAQKIADEWGITLEETAEITSKNAHNCFKKLK